MKQAHDRWLKAALSSPTGWIVMKLSSPSLTVAGPSLTDKFEQKVLGANYRND